MRADQVTRDDEKYVHADEAAAHAWEPDVKENNNKNGDAAKAVNVRSIGS